MKKKLLYQSIRLTLPSLERISAEKAAQAAYQMLRMPYTAKRDEGRHARRVFAGAETFCVHTEHDQIQVYRWSAPFHGPVRRRPLAMLVHGWNSSARSMAGLVGPLVFAGFDVVAFDLPGHGCSSGVLNGLPACLSAMSAVVTYVGPVHTLVGHSLGGMLCALAAVPQSNLPVIPSVERMALISAPDRFASIVDRFSNRLGLRRKTSTRLHELMRDFLQGPEECFSTASAVWAARIPTLVIHDHDDPVVPHKDGTNIASLMEEGIFVSTDRLGHRGTLRSSRVAQEVACFAKHGISNLHDREELGKSGKQGVALSSGRSKTRNDEQKATG